MTTLTLFADHDPHRVLDTTNDPGRIAELLAQVGVVYEQWGVRDLPSGAAGDDVLAAFAPEVERIRAMGYHTVDVARLAGDPGDAAFLEQAAAARTKFLAEHRHADDEVRFFVEGAGAFYLRLERPDATTVVHVVLCEAGDFLSVPRGTRHWFDMGTRPRFTAIRFFQDPEGWVGDFTGDPIASTFPTFDDLVAAA
jgi:1,2-dihydroxy-3-keto-5-methylthiopentene dioxygenase